MKRRGSSNKGPSRSVVDFNSEDHLRDALLLGESSSHLTGSPDASNTSKVLKSEHVDDWVLPKYDPETTEAQSMKEELRRLQVLKSYLMLDSDREEAFERITRVAAKTFNVPIALVSLVDLGRQWFMSNRGLPTEVRETPRRLAFCAHAILQKKKSKSILSSNDGSDDDDEFLSDKNDQYPILIVPDATQDFRFRDNALVTGAPFIRFYGGAPLVSPEGYRLGTLCIISDKTRPQGLDASEQRILRDLAAMVVQLMVDRRHRIESQGRDAAQLIASTAHELMTPLTGVQLSLSLLKEDEEVKNALGQYRLELLNTAMSCADLMIRICQTSVDDMRSKSGSPSEINSSTSSIPIEGQPSNSGSFNIQKTRMTDLKRSLHMLMEPIPKKVPIIITLDASVPGVILADDLKLFRSALSILNFAANRTATGSIHLKIFASSTRHEDDVESDYKNVLVFECEDTGINISEQESRSLFETGQHDGAGSHSQMTLSSVAPLIDSLDGDYGFRPRCFSREGEPPLTDSNGQILQGAIFWFSIPLIVPAEDMEVDKPVHLAPTITSVESDKRPTCDDVIKRRLQESFSVPVDQGIKSIGVANYVQEDFESSMKRSLSYGNFKRRAMLHVPTKEQADAICNSCLGGVFDVQTGPAAIVEPVQRVGPSSRKFGSAPCLQSKLLHKTASEVKSRQNADWEKSTNQLKYLEKSNADNEKITKGTNSTNPANLANALAAFHMHSSGAVYSASASASPLTQNHQNHQKIKVNNAAVGMSKFVEKSKIIETPTISAQPMPENTKKEEVPSTSVSSSSSSSDETRPKSALVIDDSLIIRKTMSRALSKLGYSDVLQAEDGMEGLQEMKKQTFDIVLCDFLMPVMDGFDCVKQYRVWEQEHRPQFHQFIAGISAHATNDDGAQGIQAGMDDFRSKPVTIKMLTELQQSPLCVKGSQQLDEMHEIEKGRNRAPNGGSESKEKTCPSPIAVIDCTGENGERNKGVSFENETKAPRRTQPRVCLIATASLSPKCNIAKSSLEAIGWNVTVTEDGTETLRLLQTRNWDAVVIDHALSFVDGMSCIDAFRTWEGQNRVNGQRNIILMCDGPIPSPRDTSSFVHPPLGCNAVIPKPIDFSDLQFLLEKDNCIDIILRT